MNTLKIETNDYYNRNIGLIPNLRQVKAAKRPAGPLPII